MASKYSCASCGEKISSNPFTCALCQKRLHPQKCAKPVIGRLGNDTATICGHCAATNPSDWVSFPLSSANPGILAISAASNSGSKSPNASQATENTETVKTQISGTTTRNAKRKAADENQDANNKKAKALKAFDQLDDRDRLRLMYETLLTNEETVSSNSEIIKQIRTDLECSILSTKQEMTELANNQKSLEARILKLESNTHSGTPTSQFENGLSISGIPTEANEDLTAKCLALFNSLKLAITREHIINCRRINPKRPGPPLTILAIVDRITRNKIVDACKKVIGGIQASIIDPTYLNQKIFVNESLPPNTLRLFKKAQTRRNELQFKYAWVRNGVIYMRQDDNMERIIIDDGNDPANLTRAEVPVTMES